MRSDVLMENYLSILDGMGTSFMTGSKGLKDQQKALPARLWKTWKHCRPSSVFFASGLVLLEDARNFQIRWWQSKKICKAGLRPWFILSIIICDSVWRCLKWGNYTKLWWWCYFNCPHQGYTPSKVLWNAIGQSLPGNDAGGPIEGWRCGSTRRSQTVPWSSIHFHRGWQ